MPVVMVTPGADLSAAIAQLPASGGEVVLSAGTFELSSKLLNASKRVSLRGAGKDITIIRAIAPMDAVVEFGANDSAAAGGDIANLTIDGGFNQCCGLRIKAVTMMTVSGVRCTNNGFDGVYADGATAWIQILRMNDCDIDNNGHNGLVVGPNIDSFQIINSTINGNGSEFSDFSQVLAVGGIPTAKHSAAGFWMENCVISGDRNAGPNVWLHNFNQASFTNVFNLSAGKESYRFTGSPGRGGNYITVIGGNSHAPDRLYENHGHTTPSYPHISFGTVANQHIPAPFDIDVEGRVASFNQVSSTSFTDTSERTLVIEAELADYNQFNPAGVNPNGPGAAVVLRGAHSSTTYNQSTPVAQPVYRPMTLQASSVQAVQDQASNDATQYWWLIGVSGVGLLALYMHKAK